MALAYPEGEVFFHRSMLFGPTITPEEFYNSFLVEYVINEVVERSTIPSHPRNEFVRLEGNKGYWKNFTLGTGDPANLQFESIHPVTPREHEDRLKGGPRKVSILRYKLSPENREVQKWLWIDMCLPIRAVYFPLAIEADENYPSLCTWVQVNMCKQGEYKVWHAWRDRFDKHPFSATQGCGVWDDWALGIAFREISSLLAVPRQLRKTTVWEAKLIQMSEHKHLNRSRERGGLWPAIFGQYDFVDVVNANYGVEFTWKPVPPDPPPKNGWLMNLIKGIVTAAAGLVPGVGPLMTVYLGMAWEAAFNPDFPQYLESGGWSSDLVGAVVGSAGDLRANGYIAEWSPCTCAGQLSTRSRGGEGVKGHESFLQPLDQIPPSLILLEKLRMLYEDSVGEHVSTSGEVKNDALKRALKLGLMGRKEARRIEDIVGVHDQTERQD